MSSNLEQSQWIGTVCGQFESHGVDIAPWAAKWERGRINYPPTAMEFGFRRMSLRAYAYLSLTATAEEAREARPLKGAAPDTSSASAFFRGTYRTGIDQLRLKRKKLGASNTNRKEPATVLG